MVGDDMGGGGSRRRFLRAAGVAGGTLGLAGCVTHPARVVGSAGARAADAVVISGNRNLADNLDTDAFYEAGVPTDVEIEMTAGPEDADDRAEAFVSQLDARESSPDLMMTDNGWTIPFAVRDDLLNLEEHLPDEFLSEVRENAFDMLVRTSEHPETGDLYGVPYFPDYATLQYRKDLFRAAGVADDADFEAWATEPPSWEEFTSLVAAVQDGTDAVEYGYLWQGDSYAGLSCCSFNELMTSHGGAYFGGPDHLFGPVGDRPITVDESGVIDAINVGRDMVHGGGDSPFDIAQVSPEATFGWSEPDVDGQFVGGNAIASRNWTYQIGMARSEWADPEPELGVMPLPRGPNGSWHALGGWLMAVNPHSGNREDALEVLQAFHSEPVQRATLEGPGFLPHEPGLFEDVVGADDVFGDFAETLAVAGENTIARPVTRVWGLQTSRVASEVNDALQGVKTPETAMTELRNELAALEEY